MKIGEWLDRRWPTERGWVTIATFVLAASLLKMAEVHHELWQVELFKTLLTLVIGTAIVNMILAFHFTANKQEETRASNTGKLADAFKTVAEQSGGAAANSAGDPPADDDQPPLPPTGGGGANESGTPATGKPGDPVHIVSEDRTDV